MRNQVNVELARRTPEMIKQSINGECDINCKYHVKIAHAAQSYCFKNKRKLLEFVLEAGYFINVEVREDA